MAYVLDQQQTSWNYSRKLRENATYQKYAQGFKPSITCSIGKVDIATARVGTIASGAKFWVELYDDSGGNPGAMLAETEHREASTIGTSNHWETALIFTTHPTINANTQYHLVFCADYAYSTANYLKVLYYNPGAYANGSLKSFDGSSWTDYSAYDMAFKEYYETYEVVGTLAGLVAVDLVPPPINIKCENQTNPTGVEDSKPELKAEYDNPGGGSASYYQCQVSKGVEQIDQYLNDSNQICGWDGYELYGSYQYGQTFKTKPGVTNITKIRVYVTKDSASTVGNIILDVYNVDANHKPTGVSLGSKTLTPSEVSTSEWTTFEFTNPISVNGNTEYALVVKAPDTQVSAPYWWALDSCGGYSDGGMLNSSDGGSNWNWVADDDGGFETYYEGSNFGSPTWDSGKQSCNVPEGNSIEIEYGGSALPFDGSIYYQKWRFWDQDGKIGSFSDGLDYWAMAQETEVKTTLAGLVNPEKIEVKTLAGLSAPDFPVADIAGLAECEYTNRKATLAGKVIPECTAPPPYGAEGVDQEQTNHSYSIRLKYDYEKLGQSFKPSITAQCPKVEWYIKRQGSLPGYKIWAEIRANNGGAVGDLIAKSVEKNCDDISTSEHWETFEFSSPPVLQGNATYHLIIDGDFSSSSSNFFYVYYADENYSNGILEYNSGGTWYYDATAYDQAFRTYYSTTVDLSIASIVTPEFPTAGIAGLVSPEKRQSATIAGLAEWKPKWCTQRYCDWEGYSWRSPDWRPNHAQLARKSNGEFWSVAWRLDKFGGSSTRSYLWVCKSTDGGKTWVCEEVRDTGTGSYKCIGDGAIAIDSQDNIHVVWWESGYGGSSNDQLLYRKKTASGWEDIEVVDSGDYNSYPDIAIDSSDNVHVVFQSQWPPVIKYRKRTTSWQTAETLASGDTIRFPRIAIDGDNHLHVIWRSEGATTNPNYYQIKYREYDGASWLGAVFLTDVSDHQCDPSIAVDSSNNVYVAWTGYGWGENEHLHIKEKTTGGWQTPEHFSGGYENEGTSLAIDGQNDIYLAFVTSGWRIDFYKKSSGSWLGPFKILGSTSCRGPAFLWARWPEVSALKTNVPEKGWAVLSRDSATSNGHYLWYIPSSDLLWEDSETQNQESIACLGMPEITKKATIAGLINPEKVEAKNLAGLLSPEKIEAKTSAGLCSPEEIKKETISGLVIPEETEVKTLAGITAPEKIEVRSSAGLADPEVTARNTLAEISTPEITNKETSAGLILPEKIEVKTLSGAVSPEVLEKKSLAGLIQIEFLKRITLAGLLNPEKKEIKSFAGLITPEETKKQTLAGLANVEKIEAKSLAGIVLPEETHKASLACLISPEKIEIKNLAGLTSLEKKEIRTLGGLANPEKIELKTLAGLSNPEFVDTLGGLAIPEETKKETAAGLANPEKIEIKTLAGLLNPEKIEVKTSAGLVNPEVAEKKSIAGLVISEETKKETTAGLVSVEKIGVKTIAEKVVPEVTEKKTFAGLATIEFLKRQTSAGLINPEKISVKAIAGLVDPEAPAISGLAGISAPEETKKNSLAGLVEPEIVGTLAGMVNPEKREIKTFAGLIEPELFDRRTSAGIASPEVTQKKTMAGLTTPEDTKEIAIAGLVQIEFLKRSTLAGISNPEKIEVKGLAGLVIPEETKQETTAGLVQTEKIEVKTISELASPEKIEIKTSAGITVPEETKKQNLAGLANPEKIQVKTLGGIVVPEETRKETLAGFSKPEWWGKETTAGLLNPEKVEVRSLASLINPEKRAIQSLASQVSPEKIVVKTLSGLVEVEKIEVKSLAGLSLPEFIDTLAGLIAPEETKKSTTAGIANPEKITVKNLAGIVNPEKIEVKVIAGLAEPEETKKGTIAELASPEKIELKTIAELVIPEETKKNTSAGLVSPEKIEVKGSAGLISLEKIEVRSLAGLANPEKIVVQNIAGLVIPEETHKADISGIADPEKIEVRNLGGLVIPEETKKETLAGLIMPEQTKWKTLAGMAVAEETKFSTLAGLVQFSPEWHYIKDQRAETEYEKDQRAETEYSKDYP